ncbi:MAG TPA: transglycosylase SLT domain-containing protein [Rhodocyclaceae bacterium]|nr:transglycosylase SLT domain-containing protein [Rhodocyclaceae bacterium]
MAVAAGDAAEADDRLPVHLPALPGGVARDSERDLAALDARDHPGTSESIVTAAAPGRVRELGGSLSEAEMRAVLTLAGWPAEWHDDALAIAWCESHWSPYAVGDGGNSLGAWQLWRGWFGPAGYSVDQAFDPLTNARVALYVRQVRGRFGGAGGWSCAERMGIE